MATKRRFIRDKFLQESSHTGQIWRIRWMASVGNLIRSIWAWRRRMFESVRYHGERSFFFAKRVRFFCNSCRIGPIIELFGRFSLFDHHLSGRLHSLRLLRTTFPECNSLFRPFLDLWCIPVEPCLVDCD